MMLKDTYLFSPVVLNGIPDFPKGTYEYDQWWREQRTRCLEGYQLGTVRITGDHYFYLNFWKIKGKKEKGRGRKTLIAPRFLQLDYEFFHQIEAARKAGKFFVITKARQRGFSEKLASLAGKEYMLFPHSQTIIVGGEKEHAENTMKMVHRGMNAMTDTEFYKRSNPSSLDFSWARFKNPGDKQYKGYFSELHCMTAKNNSQVLIGKTPSLIIFEEAGKFANLIPTYNYIRPALESEGETTGFAIIVGTGGEMGKGADQLMKMFYNPAAYNMMEYDDVYSENYDSTDTDKKKVGYFVPAWKFLHVDEDGNDLYENSVNHLIKKREEKNSDSTAYFNELTQNPIYSEESFLISDGTFFDSAKLNRRLAEVRKSKELSTRGQKGDLIWQKQGANIMGIKWVPDENGPFLIFEHPEMIDGKVPDNLYYEGTDSYDRDEAASSDSMGSSSILKGFIKASSTYSKFVARYTARPDTAKEFHEGTAKLHYYYNAQNLIEYSNLLIIEWYKNNGFEYALKERPEIAYANVKFSTMQNKYGIDPATKFEWLKMLRDYISANCDKLDDEEQILKFLKFRLDPNYNCDITICSALAVVNLEDSKDIVVRTSKDINLQKFRIGFKFEKGKLMRKYA